MFGKKKNEDYSVKTVKVGVDKLTTIALGTMVKGTITVEGDVSCRGKVVIGPQGRIKGNVTCTGAVLHGMLQGDIQVAEDLIMKSGCTMNGDVYTCKLEIESKARFNGTCNTTEKDTLVTSQVVKPETVDTEK